VKPSTRQPFLGGFLDQFAVALASMDMRTTAIRYQSGYAGLPTPARLALWRPRR